MFSENWMDYVLLSNQPFIFLALLSWLESPYRGINMKAKEMLRVVLRHYILCREGQMWGIFRRWNLQVLETDQRGVCRGRYSWCFQESGGNAVAKMGSPRGGGLVGKMGSWVNACCLTVSFLKLATQIDPLSSVKWGCRVGNCSITFCFSILNCRVSHPFD